MDKYYKPIYFSKVARNWEAIEKWCLEYFVRNLGDSDLLISFYNPSVTSYMHATYLETKRMSVSKYINLLNSDEASIVSAEEVQSIMGDFGGLIQDVEHFKPLLQSELGERMVSLWWAGAERITDWHTDDIPLVLCQIKGKKELLLLPPAAEEKLDPISKTDFYNFLTNNGIDESVAKEEVGGTRFANTKAFIDNIESEFLQRFTLEPGDCVLIPKEWWHAARSKDESIAVNFELFETDELGTDL